MCVHHIHSRKLMIRRICSSSSFIKCVLSYLFIRFIHQMCSIRFVHQNHSSNVFIRFVFIRLPHHILSSKLCSSDLCPVIDFRCIFIRFVPKILGFICVFIRFVHHIVQTISNVCSMFVLCALVLGTFFETLEI